MTYKVDQKNSFKKNPLRGLEYDPKKEKVFPFVQAMVIMLLLMAIATGIKIHMDKPEKVTVNQLNARK